MPVPRGFDYLFQYLKGAIRSILPELRGRSVETIFQYLKGAIRRLDAHGIDRSSVSFQYLKGAIRRRGLP